MKNKKIIISIIIIIAIIIAIVVGILLSAHNQEDKAKQTLQNFVSKINEKDYEAMYDMTAEMNMSKEDFITRNKNIYEGIDSSNITVEITEIQKQKDEYKISYHQKMYTAAGEVEFNNVAYIEKQKKDMKLKWESYFIFPNLGVDDKVRISTIKASRGTIYDRNNVVLAQDGNIASVGIVPGKLGENRDTNIEKIANLTGVTSNYINQELSASWVKDDTFVPIKKIVDSNTELKNSLLEIPGVMINKEAGRVYPLGKEAAHLIGYVQGINEEELEENSGKGYNTNSLIGKSGLEKAYEETLHGKDGSRIYIEAEDGKEKGEIIKQEKQDGKDVILTIDSKLQKQIYEQMKDDKGFFVVMEPQTGELLALVSTPTFDSNDFVVGLTTDKWNELNNDVNKPLYNRFIQKYCPGSTFKPITGAVGLTTGKINATEDYGYTGTSWQKDNSWGNYKITTLTEYSGAKNLLNGMIHSDNIYFAQSALKIGSDTFTDSLNKIGFNKSIEFPLGLAKSQYANNNGEKIEGGETKLADSGYGQGSILVNPIHMAAIYSAFANEGNIIKPHLEYSKEKQGEVLIENAFSKEAANTIKEAMIQVVENKEGTANDMKISETTIAGKTGTAELKTSSEDSESGTLRMV